MLVFKKINFILSLTFIWIIIWNMLAIGYDSYHDPILNCVPHSKDYLENNPVSSYVPKAKKPKYVVMIVIDMVWL